MLGFKEIIITLIVPNDKLKDPFAKKEEKALLFWAVVKSKKDIKSSIGSSRGRGNDRRYGKSSCKLKE